MELVTLVVLAVVLVGVSAALVLGHLKGWREAKQAELEPAEYDYRRRQFGRRMQTSAMLGVLGILIPLGSLIPPRNYPSLFVFYWWGVALLVLWIALLALADAVSTRQHVARLRRQYQRELDQAKRELLEREGNGAQRDA